MIYLKCFTVQTIGSWARRFVVFLHFENPSLFLNNTGTPMPTSRDHRKPKQCRISRRICYIGRPRYRPIKRLKLIRLAPNRMQRQRTVPIQHMPKLVHDKPITSPSGRRPNLFMVVDHEGEMCNCFSINLPIGQKNCCFAIT